MITPELPYPLDQGGRIRMFNILKHLAERHELQLIAGVLTRVSSCQLKGVEPYCDSIYLVSHRDSCWRGVIRVARSVVSRRPYVVYKHTSRSLKRIVRSVVEKVKPDVLLVEFHYISDCIDGISLPRVVDMHNIDWVLYERFASSPRFGLKKIHGLIQRPLMYDFERQVPRRFDACVVVSEKDAAVLRNMSGATNIAVVPNGVDITYFRPLSTSVLRHDLVYVGSMDYYPNVDAVLFLCREIMPLVWRQRPETTLAIVGRNPPNVVRTLQKDGRIHVTGAVEDVRPYWAGASLVMLPLRIGGGTKLKVLEAAAMGKAIIGTSVALEGIDFENGRHAVFGDRVEELASAALELLGDERKRDRLGLAARQFVCQRYSWQACVRQLERVLEFVRQGKKVQ